MAQALRVQRLFPQLAFEHLTNLVQPDDGLDRIFVTEQAGRILVLPNDRDAAEAAVFLDITDRVEDGGTEEGLLGLAFDPGYSVNGYLYVYYSAALPRRSVLSRFSLSRTNPGVADPDSERIIMEIPQPAANHNGGQLAFGPDAYLYVGLGDGGYGGDPFRNGQNVGTLLGTILRLDVTDVPGGAAYAIPPDNPFVGVAGAREEVWAYGFRNPWRFSFDELGDGQGRLWVADVGQNRWEEIDLVEPGLNYGWNVMEGAHCFSSGLNCDTAGLQLPVIEYDHSDGCSVTGGYVYRGQAIPSLVGSYLYGDFCPGRRWGVRDDGRTV
ncbi:MAG: PQQ-dependent sugar dehydrogenase, partial [Chloroflexi bacterium]|nr:PQQ-dependent sugar dehydrogenase [Chloroflexota bacterium]